MKSLLHNITFVCTVMILTGCGGANDGPATFPVSGKVTWDGKPVVEGNIIFRDAEEKTASAAGKIEDGEFSFRAIAGKKTVVITATREVPGKTAVGGAPDEPAVPAIEQYIPADYNEKSTLEAVVSDSGSNEFEFDLKSKK
ncbi:hypothetical protein [uncultured Gimesia sp.]|uniref:hypothetical protein n=1 Tax=uncultured Gimesia sp. TaxID=1678688 RepID=UPI00261BDD29|nr:hypothetical protein [uncultured Gimesia sp.]